MKTHTILAVVMAGCLSLAVSRPADAWHGFPPYGAWAYGSYPSFGHVHSRTVYRTHGFGWPASYGWGSYGNVGFTATTRLHYHRHYRPYIRYHTPIISLAYPSYVYPTYWYPAPITTYQYVAPVYSAPICADYATPLAYSGLSTTPNSSPPTITQSSTLAPQLSLTANPADTKLSAKLIASTNKHPVDSEVPSGLLTAADAILQAGGYRQAATAYAQLAVRFGTSDQLLGRRFVAQVANGDLDQAEAILQIAELTGHQIIVLDLPNGNLQELLMSNSEMELCVERLAARALSHAADSVPLRSIATWLELAGQPDRAGLFLARVEQMNQGQRVDSLTPQAPQISKKVELVSFE